MESSNHPEDPKSESEEGRLQRVELQQVPSMATHRLRQGGLHRRRPTRPPQHRHPILLAGDHCHWEQRLVVQLGSDGAGALQLHLRSSDESQGGDRVLQRRRPGLP